MRFQICSAQAVIIDPFRVMSWLPGEAINLGLDLQGGSHLLLRADLPAVQEEQRPALLNSCGWRFGMKKFSSEV